MTIILHSSVAALALSLASLSVLLAGCGPSLSGGPSRLSLAGPAPSIAPAPAPRTLESTLRLADDVEEIPFNPEIAHSAHGDTVAVWEQFDGTRYSIWANTRRAHQDWGRASLIGNSDAGHAYDPHVVINAGGRAVVVWVQSGDSARSYQLWASHLEPGRQESQESQGSQGNQGSGWSTATRLEANHSGLAYSPQVAIDDHGNATAVWQQSDGRRFTVRASRYAPDTGWGRAVRLDKPRGKFSLGAPQVAMDQNGNAMVAWPQFPGSQSELWANRFTAGRGWGQAARIESVLGQAHSLRMRPEPGDARDASDTQGNFIAVWQQASPHGANFWASRYREGQGWRTSRHGCTGLQVATTASRGELPVSRGRGSLDRSEDCY